MGSILSFAGRCRPARTSADCRAVWESLKSGSWHIASSFWRDERHYLLLQSTNPGTAAHDALPDHSVLEWVVVASQKWVGLDMGRSPSTIATQCRRSLTRLGLRCLPSKIPYCLFSLVHAARNGSCPPGFELSEFSYGGHSYRVVSSVYPEAALAEVLPKAEHDVVTRMIRGLSHAEIAIHRNASRRTVANQTASAFKRLGVSGRAELLRLLAAMRTPSG